MPHCMLMPRGTQKKGWGRGETKAKSSGGLPHAPCSQQYREVRTQGNTVSAVGSFGCIPPTVALGVAGFQWNIGTQQMWQRVGVMRNREHCSWILVPAPPAPSMPEGPCVPQSTRQMGQNAVYPVPSSRWHGRLTEKGIAAGMIPQALLCHGICPDVSLQLKCLSLSWSLAPSSVSHSALSVSTGMHTTAAWCCVCYTHTLCGAEGGRVHAWALYWSPTPCTGVLGLSLFGERFIRAPWLGAPPPPPTHTHKGLQ